VNLPDARGREWGVGIPKVCGAHIGPNYSTSATVQAQQIVGYALVVGETARSAEKIITNWSLAPRGVRRRAEELRARGTPGSAVCILRLASHGLISGGAWVVALSSANGGRRRFVYAESDQGELLGEWRDEEWSP